MPIISSHSIHRVALWLVVISYAALGWQAVWIIALPLDSSWGYGVERIYLHEILIWLAALVTVWYWCRERATLPWRPRLTADAWKSLFVISTGGLVAWALLSTLWSPVPDLTLQHARWLAEAAMLMILTLALRVSQRHVAWAIIALGVGESVLAVWQFATQYVPPSKWLGIAPQFPETLGVAVVAVSDERWLRAYGTLSHPNVLGGLLAIALLLALWRVIHGSQRERLWLTIAALVMCVGLLLTFSRGAWLAAGVGGIVMIVAVAWQQREKFISARKSLSLLLLMCTILTIIFWSLLAPRLTVTGRLEQQSLQSRAELVQMYQPIMRDHLLIGVGSGAATAALRIENPDQPGWAYQPPHQVWRVIVVELGVIGVALLCIMCLSAFIIGVRRQPALALSCVGALSILSVFDHYLWTLYPGIVLMWLIIGLLPRSET